MFHGMEVEQKNEDRTQEKEIEKEIEKQTQEAFVAQLNERERVAFGIAQRMQFDVFKSTGYLAFKQRTKTD